MIDKGKSLEKIKAEIKAVEELSRNTLAQVRDAVKGYNVATINGEVLQVRVATEAANIELIASIEVASLPINVESELALIIREAITNVIRHAETEKVWIVLKQVTTHLSLTISDQGQITTKKEQSGMQNMRTRIEHLGGKMEIENAPNTQLIFTLPITQQSQTNDVIATLSNVTNG